MGYKMKCGHIAQGYNQKGEPICIICDCSEIDNEKPDLTGRMAYCTECSSCTQSDWNLAFFKYNENLGYDEYYCGCHGWD